MSRFRQNLLVAVSHHGASGTFENSARLHRRLRFSFAPPQPVASCKCLKASSQRAALFPPPSCTMPTSLAQEHHPEANRHTGVGLGHVRRCPGMSLSVHQEGGRSLQH